MSGRSVALYISLACFCINRGACTQPTDKTASQTFPSAKFVVFPVCVASHWYQSLSIIKQLSHRGHSVQVVLSGEFAAAWRPRLAKLPNVTTVSYNTFSIDELAIRQQLRETQRAVGLNSVLDIFGMPKHSHPLLQNAEVHRQIQDFGPDLAMVDVSMIGGQALANKLGVPAAILAIAGDLPPISGHAYGSGANLLSTVPQWQVLVPRQMSFLQRLQNVVGHVVLSLVWTRVIEPHMGKTMWQQYNIPPYSYVKSNRQVPLVLMHMDWANFNANPMAPHTVAVGALTAAPAKALPSELEGWMQSAGEHGVVYASLGTTAIPEAAELRAIARALSAIAPATALWKLSDSDLVAVQNSSVPVGSNVKIVKWAPQNDVLGHPSVKAFFTQGGTNSFNEASYHGVPMVGMPLCAEQPDNIMRAQDRGYALAVSVKKLDTLAQDLENSLKRILKEPSFAERAARVSHIMKAHRQAPVEVAADALEHAAWTNGSRHMQPLRDDLNWFQTTSLDVILFMTAVTLTLLCVAGLLLIYVSRRVYSTFFKRWHTSHSKQA